MTPTMKKPDATLTANDRLILGALINQLTGVLICTLGACEGRPNIPTVLLGAVEAAARIAQEAQRML